MQQNYIEEGQGEALILLHGNGEDHSYFSHQIPAFSPFYHVYAVDTRGHGKTPRGEGEFSLCRFAEDLLLFMDSHQIEKAHLLGFSDGGNIALLFALQYPHRVGKLILNGANLYPRGLKKAVLREAEKAYAWGVSQEKINPLAKKILELMKLILDEPQIKPASLGKLTMPTLVIAGTKDMITERHTKMIARHIPHGELTFLEGSHFIARDSYSAFNERVLSFLREEK